MQGTGNDFWDDPEWQNLRKRVNGQPTPKLKSLPKEVRSDTPAQSVTQKQEKKLNVSFSISAPSLPKLPKFTPKQVRIGLVSGLVVLSAGLLVWGVRAKLEDKNQPNVLGGTVQAPDFETLLPKGKEEETSSGRLGYDPTKKVVSFTDMIGAVAITVSQQSLPQAFKDNPDEELKKVAEGFSANEVILESNPKAYLGTSVKGPQTVIFHKKNLLVFIQSADTIDKNEWAAYITQLL